MLAVLALLVTASGAGASPFAYISNLSSGTVTAIDGTTVLTSPAITVGPQPFGVAVNPAGTRAYVANSNMFDSGVPSVSVIDTASLSVVATITTGITGQPWGIAVNEDGSRVYVANNNGTVAVIDATSNTVINTIAPPNGQGRQLAAIVVAGGSLFATDLFTGEVLNLTDSAVPGLFVSFGMMGIAANSSGSRLYVSYGEAADGNLKIAIIDVATSFAQQTFTSVQISTSGNDAGFNPGGIAVSPSGAFVYAPILSENRLAVMSTGNNSVMYRATGSAPFGVGIDPLGTRVYVVNSGSRNVSVFDAATHTLLQTVAVGINPMVFGSFVADARPAPPPPQFVLTVLTAGNGFGSVMADPMPGTNGTYPAGTVVALTATPNQASQFTGWSGACTGTGACSVTMDAAKSVTANFALRQYTLSVALAGNGSGTVTPPGGTYNHGTVVSLSATPAASSVFTGWSGACTGSTACSVTMDAAKSVTATFALRQYTLSVSTNGTGFGTVAPSGGTYNHGTTVSVTATPAASSVFAGWSGACSGTGACSVTMDAAKSVTATFTLRQYSLSVSTNGTGSGTVAPSGGMYNHGATVGCTATPASGSVFSGWSGACSGMGACNVTMDAARSVTASFTLASPPPPPPTTCDEKIKDLEKKVASNKHPWKHNHQLKAALRLYGAAQVEMAKAKAKVGENDKRYLRAKKEFANGKAALCDGRYWRAHHELWEAYYIAHEIVKNHNHRR